MFRNVYIRSFRQRSGAWLYWVSCQTLVLCGSRPQIVLKHLEDGRLTMQIYLYVVRLLVRTSLNVTVYKTKN